MLGEWIDINCGVVESKEGLQSVGTSQGFPIPDKYITKDEVSRIDLTRNAFIMALTKHINGDVWR